MTFGREKQNFSRRREKNFDWKSNGFCVCAWELSVWIRSVFYFLWQIVGSKKIEKDRWFVFGAEIVGNGGVTIKWVGVLI